MSKIVSILFFVHIVAITSTSVYGRTVYCDSGPFSVFPPVNKTLRAGSPCYQDQYRNIVVFGDSWSENGEGPLNATSYAFGDYQGRMTNGPTWNEYLSAFMGTNLFNHAYSGATANNTILPRAVPDVSEQIQEFHTNHTSLDDQVTLYIIWTGVNDVHDIYVATSNTTEQHILLDSIIGSIANEMTKFPQGDLLILGLAPIQHLPLFTQHIGTSDALLDLIDRFNDKLRALAQDQAQFIDTSRLFKKYFTLRGTDGFADITQACIRDFKQCLSSQFNYLWWDDWHPSTATHQLIATDLYDILHNINP